MPSLFDEQMKVEPPASRSGQCAGGRNHRNPERIQGPGNRQNPACWNPRPETESLIRRRQYLEKQRAEIEQVLSEVYTDIGRKIKDKSVEVGQAGAEIADDIIKKVVPARLSD